MNDIKQSSGFSVSGAGSSAGGAVTFSVAPSAGVMVTLRRNLSVQRMTDFQESGDFRAATLNDELDYQIAALQNLAADIATAVRIPPTDQAANLILPKKGERAGKILGFDHNGGVAAWVLPQNGVSAHAQLSGLQSDDHPQYLTSARANAWLGAKTADSLAEGITNKYMRLAGTGTNTTAARTDHHHAAVYEPAFPKNTAFNKNFGTIAGSVAEGNHRHALGDLSNVDESGRLDGYALVWSSTSGRWEAKAQGGGGGAGGLANAYAGISDGANGATANGSETLRVRSSTGSIAPVIGANDPLFGDNIDLNVVFAGTGSVNRAARSDHTHPSATERLYKDAGTHTWTKPAGLRYVEVKVRGGGGGGGGNSTSSGIGGGGGGQGGLRQGLIPASGLPESVSVTVGAGGAGGASGTLGNPGSPGGPSSFGPFLIADGGEGGLKGDGVYGGAGGGHSGAYGFGVPGSPGMPRAGAAGGCGGGEGGGRTSSGSMGGGGGGLNGAGPVAYAGGPGYVLIIEHF